MDEFYNDWISNEIYWFNCSNDIDNYLTLKYEHLLNYDLNLEHPIKFIILYDQLPRHIFRNTMSNHIIQYFLIKALDIINHYKYNQIFINNLTNIDWIFFMLPLRHTNIKNNIIFVIKQFPYKYIKNNYNFLLKKFIIATLKNSNYIENLNQRISYFYNNYILDFIPSNNTIFNNPIFNFQFNNNNINQAIISLSGGVDSMVCLHNCILLYPQINWICIHINYNNRIESNDETRFIAYYCYKYNIKLYVRDIDEVNRNFYKSHDLREIYEEYTKKIRYNCYKSFSSNPIVILGHNKDDCFENILTNISYNTKYENLKGMTNISYIDNITFIRPLINISKNDIYIYAQENNIPYLKNSTPKWSQRGQIRNNIIPTLNKWNNNIINGIFNISTTLENLYQFINIYVDNIISNTNNNNLILKFNELNFNKIFWKLYFFKLYNISPSNKSLDYFINRLFLWYNKQFIKINKLQIIIKKNFIFQIIYNNNNTLFISYLHLK